MDERSTARPEADAENEEDEALRPPSAERVLRRAYCLAALALRGFAERDGADELRALAAEAPTWLARHGIDEELEESERALLATPIGSAEPHAIVPTRGKRRTACRCPSSSRRATARCSA